MQRTIRRTQKSGAQSAAYARRLYHERQGGAGDLCWKGEGT